VTQTTGWSRTPEDFERMFRSEYPRVVAAVRWVAGELPAAEEAAQEAFCRALERWDRVRRHERPGAWVQVTALRVAVRRRRRDADRARLVPAWSPPPAAAPSDVDLQRALAALPDGQRAAVVLHHLLDLSVDEAASVLGVSAGTVKTQLHRARARLAAALGEPEEVRDGAR
jgi:RNA polymerase sigma-70 factor (ECF subfamily)